MTGSTTPLALRIEPGTIDDVPTILTLVQALADYEELGHLCVATEDGVRESLFGPAPDADVIIARVGDEVAGFALFFPTYSTFLAQRGLYLEDLFVRPEFRGRGIGKALLARLARIAVERGCGRLEWSVLNWNTPSIGFYKSLGARAMDEWTVFRLSGAELRDLATG